MLWINFKRILQTGLINFWRNGIVSLSAVLIMSITLFIIATVIFTSALLQHTLDSLQEKVDVNINMLTTASEEEILNLKTELEKLPEIQSVEYISRQQALDNYRARHQNNERTLAALDELDENPLGASLNINAKDPKHYEMIDKFLSNSQPGGNLKPIIDNVNFAQKKEVIEKLSIIIDAGKQFGILVTTIFIILSILITLNTIRLAIFISKEEIKLMNLVGAEHGYISGPFVITGAFYGIISSILVLILLYPVTYFIGPRISPVFFDMNLFIYYLANFGQMFLIIFFSGILIGAISSFLAINRYLKIK
jgi:cell division transport system permease protein